MERKKLSKDERISQKIIKFAKSPDSKIELKHSGTGDEFSTIYFITYKGLAPIKVFRHNTIDYQCYDHHSFSAMIGNNTPLSGERYSSHAAKLYRKVSRLHRKRYSKQPCKSNQPFVLINLYDGENFYINVDVLYNGKIVSAAVRMERHIDDVHFIGVYEYTGDTVENAMIGNRLGVIAAYNNSNFSEVQPSMKKALHDLQKSGMGQRNRMANMRINGNR